MATIYFLRIRWFLKWPLAKERQPATGMGDTNPKKGQKYSLATIVKPWELESARSKPIMYTQFALFHLGVVAAISLSFIILYGPGLLKSVALVSVMQFLTGAACVIGVMRIIRRISDPYIKAISSLDDHFSLILLTVWFAFAFMAAPNNISNGEGVMLTYFLLTAFFLMYVPFSKISHYLYYPFTRTYLGRHFGRRGVFPIKRNPAYQANK
jgi:nitrate reductase gamma subunit